MSSGSDAVRFLSFEVLPELEEVTGILVEGTPTGDQPIPETKELFRQLLWQKLTAVKEGRVYALHHYYALHYKQALAVLNQVEGILKGL